MAALRAQLRQADLDAYIVPSEDAHQSEYPAARDARRAYISGFNGSAGTAIVTADNALLFTDGRYFLQAGAQLEPGVWTLMRQGEQGVPTWQDYVAHKLPPGSKVGVSPELITASDAAQLQSQLSKRQGQLIALDGPNPVDLVWDQDPSSPRPAAPAQPIFSLDDAKAGASFSDKVAAIRAELQARDPPAQGLVANMLDEVAWLFNLRGSDVPYNPVFFAYALVLQHETWLFVQPNVLTPEAEKELAKYPEVKIKPYDTFYSELRAWSKTQETSAPRVLLGERASLAIQRALGGPEKTVIDRNIIQDHKAVKTPAELAGFNEAHIRDGVALVQYFYWLQNLLQSGGQVNEYDAAAKLTALREAQPGFQGESFETISSTGANAAVIHYGPPPQGSPLVDKDQIYLCDSGVHFDTPGTTDVTRTWHFGTPTAQEVRANTRVLQGHIALATTIFPSGTTGYVIDSLARKALWSEGWDYKHGTGHGVGAWLNVHEGPHGINTRAASDSTALKPGMIVSNEPGFYLDQHFGIRIESLLAVRPADVPNKWGARPFLAFDTITLCPIQASLVDGSLLSPDEKGWMKGYHERVYRELAPRLEALQDAETLAWLKRECEAASTL